MTNILFCIKVFLICCQLVFSADVDSELISELDFFENYQLMKDQEIVAPVVNTESEELLSLETDVSAKNEVVK
jgi:hypothetical protein